MLFAVPVPRLAASPVVRAESPSNFSAVSRRIDLHAEHASRRRGAALLLTARQHPILARATRKPLDMADGYTFSVVLVVASMSESRSNWDAIFFSVLRELRNHALRYFPTSRGNLCRHVRSVALHIGRSGCEDQRQGKQDLAALCQRNIGVGVTQGRRHGCTGNVLAGNGFA